MEVFAMRDTDRGRQFERKEERKHHVFQFGCVHQTLDSI